MANLFQTGGFCDEPDVHCNYDYGHSLGRGSWQFVPGEWLRLAQVVTLNTIGQLDGKIVVLANGEEVYRCIYYIANSKCNVMDVTSAGEKS